jgi:hypothetical protein
MSCCNWFDQTSEVWDRLGACVLGARLIVLSDSTRHLMFERHYKHLCSLEPDELLQVIQPGIWGLRELPCFCVLGARWIVASDSTWHPRFKRPSELLCSWSKIPWCLLSLLKKQEPCLRWSAI